MNFQDQKFRKNSILLWCHNCQQHVSSPSLPSDCPHCHSQALEQDEGSPSPSLFQPFQIHFSIIDMLPPAPLPTFDTSQFDRPVRILVHTTVLQSTSDPRRVRVVREYYVRPVMEEAEKCPVDAQTLAELERRAGQVECPICQDDHAEMGIVLPCLHAFHEKCLCPWLEETNTCPCCRAEVTSSTQA